MSKEYTTLHQSEIEVGDRVIFVKNDIAEYDVGRNNPLVGTEYECEGVVEEIDFNVHVLWDNGHINEYDNYTLAKVNDNKGTVISIWE